MPKEIKSLSLVDLIDEQFIPLNSLACATTMLISPVHNTDAAIAVNSLMDCVERLLKIAQDGVHDILGEIEKRTGRIEIERDWSDRIVNVTFESPKEEALGEEDE